MRRVIDTAVGSLIFTETMIETAVVVVAEVVALLDSYRLIMVRDLATTKDERKCQRSSVLLRLPAYGTGLQYVNWNWQAIRFKWPVNQSAKRSNSVPDVERDLPRSFVRFPPIATTTTKRTKRR